MQKGSAILASRSQDDCSRDSIEDDSWFIRSEGHSSELTKTILQNPVESSCHRNRSSSHSRGEAVNEKDTTLFTALIVY